MARAKDATPAAPAKATAAPSLVIDLTPSPDARQGLTLRVEAQALTVVDKASHLKARQWIVGAKQLRGAIDEHWRRITRVIDKTKKDLLGLKGDDLEPVDQAIAKVEGVIIAYEDADARRVRAEEERRRREQETQARLDREAELLKADEEALELERNSAVLSKREQVFVDYMAIGDPNPVIAARAAGFTDPEGAAARLRKTPKIIDAIHAKKTAKAIRENAEATRQAPLDVAPIEKVASGVSRGAGSRRTYYSVEIVDETKFLAAVLHGEVASEAIMPRMTYLNQQAKDSPDIFERSFPGCRLVKDSRIGG